MFQFLSRPLSRPVNRSLSSTCIGATLLVSQLKQHYVFSTTTPTMAPTPSTMKAVQIDQNGGTEVLRYRSVPIPTAGKGQLLVRNQYAGVNFIDTYFRSGLYESPQLPLTLGREAAGTVVSGPPEFPVGARVIFMGASGAYAEYTVINASEAILIPESIPTEQAVAVYIQGLTACTFIREAGQVQAGEWVLVHAAAGGVGLFLVQMLRSLGAKVVGTASSEGKRRLAETNGAEWTIDSNDDVVARVNEITGGHGIDIIFDGVGKATFDADLEMIAPKGRLISFGNASGVVDPFNILRLARKNVNLMRPMLDGYVSDRESLERYTKELWDLIIAKKLGIIIHDIYPLEETARAHQDIEGRKTTGKLLIKCD